MCRWLVGGQQAHCLSAAWALPACSRGAAWGLPGLAGLLAAGWLPRPAAGCPAGRPRLGGVAAPPRPRRRRAGGDWLAGRVEGAAPAADAGGVAGGLARPAGAGPVHDAHRRGAAVWLRVSAPRCAALRCAADAARAAAVTGRLGRQASAADPAAACLASKRRTARLGPTCPCPCTPPARSTQGPAAEAAGALCAGAGPVLQAAAQHDLPLRRRQRLPRAGRHGCVGGRAGGRAVVGHSRQRQFWGPRAWWERDSSTHLAPPWACCCTAAESR